MEVLGTLQGYGTDRAKLIIAWIENEFGVKAPTQAEVEKAYHDPNITADWLDDEQGDHNPKGNAPKDFRFRGGRGDGEGYS